VKRFNFKLLLILLGAAVLCGAGLVALNRFQVNRNAGGIAKLARQRLEEGKPAEALALFTRYLGMRPQDAAVHAEYARLVLERANAPDATQADLSRAYNALEEAVRRNPNDDALRRDLAEFQIRVGRFTDAREHLEMLAEHLGRPARDGEGRGQDGGDPSEAAIDSQTLQLLLARSYAGDGDFDRAGRLVGDLVGYDIQTRRFDPNRDAADSTDAYILLATILQERLGDAAAANVALQELVERRSGDAQAWLALARWHRQQGEFEDATREIDKALALAPDDANVLFGAFEVALARKDMAGAEKIANQARELFAADERVYRGLASIALQRNDLETAEKVLRDGVAELPGKASLLLMFADTLLQRGNFDEVDQVIRRIEDLYGTTSPAVGLMQARLMIGRRQWPQAKRKLEEIRPLAAGIPQLMRQIDLCLGQCFESLGEFDEQLDVSRRLLVDDPTSLAARVGAAGALAAAGRSAEALQEFELVASSLPEDRLATIPQVWYPLLQLRLVEQLKRPVADRDWSGIDGLIGSLEQSTAVSADQLALLRADVLSRKGELEPALDLLEKASLSPDASSQVWSALATLALRSRGPAAAREMLGRVPEAQRGNPGLLALRAQLAVRDDADAGAAELAEVEKQAESMAPPEAAALLSTLAGLRLEMGERQDAERLWRAAAERQPEDLQSRSALMDLAIRSGDLARAKAAAADVEAVAGADSARAKVAQAAVRIMEVRSAQKPEELNAGRIDLSADESGLLDTARNLLIEAENDRPGWQQIQVLFAELEGLKGNTPAAIDHLQKALRLAPGNVQIIRQLVALLFGSNRIDEARKTLESLGPDGVSGFERVTAEMELRSGRLDEAVALAERSVNLDSKDVNELLWLGQLLERSGKPERAIEVVRRAVDVAPERPEPWLTLFSLEMATGKRKAAERTLERAVDKLSSPARELVQAQGSELLGRVDDAERAYTAAVEAAPDDMGIARTRAEFLIRAGRSAAGGDALRRIIASSTDAAFDRQTKAWARRRLASYVAERGDYESLREALELLGLNSQDGVSPAEDATATIGLLANRPEPESWRKAIEAIERLRDSQPLTTGQRLTLAGLLDKSGRWPECREEMLSIVAAPTTPPAFIAILIDKLINHDELADARTWLRRLGEQAPEAPVTIALEARLAVAEKDRPRAAEAARRLMPPKDLPADQAGQLAALARLLEDLGFAKAADKVLTQYAALSTEGVVARAEFLGRQKRGAEALDLLDGSRDSLSLERFLSTAVGAARVGTTSPDVLDRVDQLLTKARRVDPESIVIALLEAEVRMLQGRPREAEAIYRQLLDRKDIDPKQAAIVANNLAFQLADPETAAEARRLIDEAITRLGPHPDLLDTRGMVRLAQDETREAIADFEQAVLQPTGVKLLHLAYAHFRAGDKPLARDTLEAGRKKGLSAAGLSADDVERLRELEKALGLQPEQAGAADGAGGRG
jgi:tetratricopeptide (TPR) repeat protein